jgi:putative two-component system response regulator
MKHDTKYDDDLILIVDDSDINRMMLCEGLNDEYRIVEAGGGAEALKLLFEDNLRPTVILLDIIMPNDIDGFEVLERITQHEETKSIPVLFITGEDSEETESKGLKAGAADYITKPFNLDIVRARVDNFVSLSLYRRSLERLVAQKAAEVTETYEQTVEVLAMIIEYRSQESGAHIRRTKLLVDTMITRMLHSDTFKEALRGENVISLVKASALHDIGKIGIPDGILLKPGKLTDEEFDKMKEHTTIGADIITSVSASLPDNDMYLKYAKDICHYHHERWDGRGYPVGLSGKDIPLCARVVSIVDVYDALANTRCYKPAYSHEESIKIIMDGRGTQFDPELIDILPEISDIFAKVIEKHKD